MVKRRLDQRHEQDQEAERNIGNSSYQIETETEDEKDRRDERKKRKAGEGKEGERRERGRKHLR